MKRMYISAAEDTNIDVSEYNEMMEELYEYILDNAPIEPSSHSIWGKGMKYLSSNQDQVYSLKFEWDPSLIDGGFELSISVDSFNTKKAINNPPGVSAKIITFMEASTANQFIEASNKLIELFKFSDHIRKYANSLF